MKHFLLTMLMLAAATTATAQNTPSSQMEKLDRGLIVIPSGTNRILSWRLLGTDDEDHTRFAILRNGTSVVTENAYLTYFVDETPGSSYQIVTKVDGVPVDTTEAVKPWSGKYLTLKLNRPEGGSDYSYSPNDCSVGDVDGDGQYEIFVKWDPSNSKDNSQGGVTGNVFIDCYKLDGTFLWRIDLGRNIRAGAHYTQFQVYDYDGDGLAELMCKTGPGSIDGTGKYVNEAATNETIKKVSGTDLYRSNDGRITNGQEWLTVFAGATGQALHTIFYNPNRNMTYGGAADGSVNWGDVDGKNDSGSYGNRGERYLAATAYIDGPDANPSAIFCRGYYGYAFIWAVSFDGQTLRQRWFSSHKSKTAYSLTTYNAEGKGTTKSFSKLEPTGTEGINSGTMFGNGNHNMSIADVDGDGCDDIVWGSAALKSDGSLLYGTGYGHGDAIHMADHCPDRPGLEVFEVHEDKLSTAWDLHDAATGEIIFAGGPSGQDNGRGMAGQFDANVRGSLFWSASDGSARSAVTSEVVSGNHGSSNFRIFWDGDLQEELLDGNKIDKWNGNGTNRLYTFSDDGGPSSTCNGSKNTPNLLVDLFGDWREEVILHNGSDQLAIYSSTLDTKYRMPTLMHDHTYRMGICWQNSAYNQPPHLGYYLPDAMLPQLVGSKELTVNAGEAIDWVVLPRYTKSSSVANSSLPSGLKKTINYTTRAVTFTGAISTPGDYEIPVSLTGLNGEKATDYVVLHVKNATGISTTLSATQTEEAVYDLQGRRLEGTKRGLNIVRKNGQTRKVFF